MIPRRAWIIPIAAVLILISVRARASELPPGIDCQTVRALVAHHGKAKALWWAVKQGYSPGEIQAARRCLRS